MGDVYSNYCFGPLFTLKSAERKDSRKKAWSPFVLLETLEILTQQDTEHLFDPPLLWMGNGTNNILKPLWELDPRTGCILLCLIVLGHCDFHPATFSHPLEADLSRSLLSGTVFSNPNSDNYLWFCCWLERRLLGIESTFPSVQKLRVRRRGISVPASLSNTWHQMHMWGWPSKINEFNRKEHILGSRCNTVQISRKCNTKALHGRLLIRRGECFSIFKRGQGIH